MRERTTSIAMPGRVVASLACSFFLATVHAADAQDKASELRQLQWEEVTADEMDRSLITPPVQSVLDSEGIDWKHAQTEHFVIHYERQIFARKVARMAEFYYWYVSEDIQGLVDHYGERRSHILIFRNKEQWDRYAMASAKWVFAYVQGPAMFLQKAKQSNRSADTLAHEMTHLVLNRFFRERVPLWFNEGLAEWYETFAYAAFKGIKKSRQSQFRRLGRYYDLGRLMQAEVVSGDVAAFYETSKYLVAFLRLDWPDETFQHFFTAITEGQDAWAALERYYEVTSVEDLDEPFKKFCNVR